MAVIPPAGPIPPQCQACAYLNPVNGLFRVESPDAPTLWLCEICQAAEKIRRRDYPNTVLLDFRVTAQVVAYQANCRITEIYGANRLAAKTRPTNWLRLLAVIVVSTGIGWVIGRVAGYEVGRVDGYHRGVEAGVNAVGALPK